VDIQPMEGRSLRPAFDGKPIDRDFLAWEHEGNRALREGDWKLVAIKGGPWELYDLRTDRVELHDLAAAQPERVKDMAAKWDAWAKRCRVAGESEPKRGGRKADEPRKGPGASSFDLKAGDELNGDAAPDIANRPIKIEAELAEPGRDGVLVAQGGDQHGYALYFKDGDLVFAVRRQRKLESVRVPAADVTGARKLEASLAADGAAAISVDGRERARGSVGGLVAVTPKDGLQVGRDEQSPAGDYTGPFPFSGKIARARLSIGKP
jgi:arylsulfatase